MIAPPNWQTEMHGLLNRLQDGGFDDADRSRLNDLLRAGEPQRDYFITYMDVHSRLAWEGGHETGVEPPRNFSFESEIPNPAFHVISPSPTLSTNHYPLTADFVGGPVFSYMVATVVLCAMLLGAWVYKISNVGNLPDEMAGKSRIETPYASAVAGQITGMKDCRWGEDEPGTIIGASVPLGRKYSLESGLLQITYKTGANVILEGPCEYIAGSRSGGYLRVGKLVARVEKKVASGQWLVASAKPQAANPQPPVPSPQSQAPFFTVTTPTAVVTDLGTEFGVEVDESGNTTSHVFQGTVRMQTVGADSQQDVVLRENESARGEGRGKPRIMVLGTSEKVADFIREIPKRTTKTFDLVDVVAGGNGFSGRRDLGINPASGKTVTKIYFSPVPPPNNFPISGNQRYNRVESNPFVDGVFIPHSDGTPVLADSAGHELPDVGITENATWQHIWAGGKAPKPRYPTCVAGVDYSAPPHGFLLLHANVAITFDLEAIRRANPGRKPLRFRSITANVGEYEKAIDHTLFADIWVLVDGEVRSQQRQEDSEWKHNGVRQISIPISDLDRFLTLAVTDAGDGIGRDWVIFGDPCLEFRQTQQKQKKEDVPRRIRK